MRIIPHIIAHYSTFTPSIYSLGWDASPRRPQAVRGIDPNVSFRAAFTVLELVMVMGVLSVLLAIIMPSTKALRQTAYRRRAAVEATALAQAAIRYKSEYGFWPGEIVPHDSDPTAVKRVVTDGTLIPMIAYGKKSFLENLTAKDGEGNSITERIIKLQDDDPTGHQIYQAFCTVGEAASPPYPINPLNPRGIQFLDLQNEDDYLRVDYRDPWGQSYVLFTGMNPRNRFTYNVAGGASGTFSQSVSNQSAFAFSFGPPEHHGTNLIYSAGVNP